MKYPMTKQGAEALEVELKHLKSELRPQITKAIAVSVTSKVACRMRR